MTNAAFATSVNEFAATERKAGKAFGSLMTYSHDVIREVTGDSKAVADVLKNSLTAEEKTYRAEYDASHRTALGDMPGAYRSAKSVIMSAVKAGVSLVDGDGKLRSKSDLEKSVKELRSEKSALEKFCGALDTAEKVFADIDTLDDVRKCKATMAVLVDMILKAEASMVGSKHREKAPLSAEEKAFIAAELQAKAAA